MSSKNKLYRISCAGYPALCTVEHDAIGLRSRVRWHVANGYFRRVLTPTNVLIDLDEGGDPWHLNDFADDHRHLPWHWPVEGNTGEVYWHE